MRFRITRLPNGQYLATSVDVPGLIGQGRYESEAASVARSCSGNGTGSTFWHLSTDPSHPPLFQFPGQKGLYRLVLERAPGPVTQVPASTSGTVRNSPDQGPAHAFLPGRRERARLKSNRNPRARKGSCRRVGYAGCNGEPVQKAHDCGALLAPRPHVPGRIFHPHPAARHENRTLVRLDGREHPRNHTAGGAARIGAGRVPTSTITVVRA